MCHSEVDRTELNSIDCFCKNSVRSISVVFVKNSLTKHFCRFQEQEKWTSASQKEYFWYEVYKDAVVQPPRKGFVAFFFLFCSVGH